MPSTGNPRDSARPGARGHLRARSLRRPGKRHVIRRRSRGDPTPQEGAMSKKPQNAISPARAEDYPGWYQEVIRAAQLAEVSPVRGCMVIRPWGYAIWE